MQAEVYWIDIPCVRLAIMARPRADEWLSDEIQLMPYKTSTPRNAG